MWLHEMTHSTMALNCLPCSQILEKTNSYREYYSEKPDIENNARCTRVERTSLEEIIDWEDEDKDQREREQSWVKFKREHRRAQSMTFSVLPVIGEESSPKIKREHRRAHSMAFAALPGCIEPRLVRSPGMRRDWSLEDLACKKNEEKAMCS